MGAHIRKGEKAATVVKFGTVEKEDENGDEKVIPFAKAYPVFNADQIEGLPADFYRKPEPAQDLGTEADPALDVFFAATGAAIDTTSQPRAFYDITAEGIHIAPHRHLQGRARLLRHLGPRIDPLDWRGITA